MEACSVTPRIQCAAPEPVDSSLAEETVVQVPVGTLVEAEREQR